MMFLVLQCMTATFIHLSWCRSLHGRTCFSSNTILSIEGCTSKATTFDDPSYLVTCEGCMYKSGSTLLNDYYNPIVQYHCDINCTVKKWGSRELKSPIYELCFQSQLVQGKVGLWCLIAFISLSCSVHLDNVLDLSFERFLQYSTPIAGALIFFLPNEYGLYQSLNKERRGLSIGIKSNDVDELLEISNYSGISSGFWHYLHRCSCRQFSKEMISCCHAHVIFQSENSGLEYSRPVATHF